MLGRRVLDEPEVRQKNSLEAKARYILLRCVELGPDDLQEEESSDIVASDSTRVGTGDVSSQLILPNVMISIRP